MKMEFKTQNTQPENSKEILTSKINQEKERLSWLKSKVENLERGMQ